MHLLLFFSGLRRLSVEGDEQEREDVVARRLCHVQHAGRGRGREAGPAGESVSRLFLHSFFTHIFTEKRNSSKAKKMRERERVSSSELTYILQFLFSSLTCTERTGGPKCAKTGFLEPVYTLVFWRPPALSKNRIQNTRKVPAL